MMLIVALGAINAIISTSCGSNSRSSIFTMSFRPALPLGTFIAMDIVLPSPPDIPKIFNTVNAFPARI